MMTGYRNESPGCGFNRETVSHHFHGERLECRRGEGGSNYQIIKLVSVVNLIPSCITSVTLYCYFGITTSLFLLLLLLNVPVFLKCICLIYMPWTNRSVSCVNDCLCQEDLSWLWFRVCRSSRCFLMVPSSKGRLFYPECMAGVRKLDWFPLESRAPKKFPRALC